MCVISLHHAKYCTPDGHLFHYYVVIYGFISYCFWKPSFFLTELFPGISVLFDVRHIYAYSTETRIQLAQQELEGFLAESRSLLIKAISHGLLRLRARLLSECIKNLIQSHQRGPF
jgi:hypothetical protein